MQPVAGEEEALDRLPSSDSGHTSKQNSKWQNICSLILHLFKNKLGLHVCDIYIEKGLEEYINSLEKKSGGGGVQAGRIISQFLPSRSLSMFEVNFFWNNNINLEVKRIWETNF